MRRSSVSLVLAALATCVAAPASAQWVRHHASECVPMIGPSLDDLVIVGAGATNVDDTGWPVELACASDDRDDYEDATVTEVRVYVYDASPTEGIWVAACANFFEPNPTFLCSKHQETSAAFVGPAVITLSGHDLAIWKEDLAFGFVYVTIPVRSGVTGFSYLKGWTTQQ